MLLGLTAVYISLQFTKQARDLQSLGQLVSEEAIDAFDELVGPEVMLKELFEGFNSDIEQSLAEEQSLRDCSGQLDLG
jgi:hypothetical protein